MSIDDFNVLVVDSLSIDSFDIIIRFSESDLIVNEIVCSLRIKNSSSKGDCSN